MIRLKENLLRNNNVKEETILSRTRVLLRGFVLIRGYIRRPIKFLVIEIVHHEIRRDGCFPQWICLWADSANIALLNSGPVLLWWDGSSEAEVPYWGCRIADVAEIVDALGFLFYVRLFFTITQGVGIH